MKHVIQKGQQDPAVSVSNLMPHWSHRAEMGTRTSYSSTLVVLAFSLLLVCCLCTRMEACFFLSMYYQTQMQMVNAERDHLNVEIWKWKFHGKMSLLSLMTSCGRYCQWWW